MRTKLWVAALCACLLAGGAGAGEKELTIGGMAALQVGFGRSIQTGAELALEEINAAGGILGTKINVSWMDSEASPSTGRTLAQRLIFNDKVPFILGCHSSTVVLAIADLMRQNKVLEIAMGSAQKVTELNNPWIVRMRENDLLTGDVLANYMVDTGKHTKIACIYMSEQYGMGGRDNLKDALKKKNLDLVAAEAHNFQDKDFTSQLLNVKKAGADAVVLISGIPDLGIMVKQARQLIPDTKIYMTSVGATKPFLDVAGEAAVGTFAVCTYTQDNPDPKVQNFVKAFEKKYGAPPLDFFSGLAYDAVYILKDCIEKTGNFTDREKIRDAYKQVKDWQGVTGLTYNGKPNGEMVNELLLIEYQPDLKQKVIAKVKGD